jgi:hypothetical protein
MIQLTATRLLSASARTRSTRSGSNETVSRGRGPSLCRCVLGCVLGCVLRGLGVLGVGLGAICAPAWGFSYKSMGSHLVARLVTASGLASNSWTAVCNDSPPIGPKTQRITVPVSAALGMRTTRQWPRGAHRTGGRQWPGWWSAHRGRPLPPAPESIRPPHSPQDKESLSAASSTRR